MNTTERIAILSAAFFFFGLAALFSLGAVWPWIMLLIMFTAIPIMWAEEGLPMTLWLAVQCMIWLGGIPLLMQIDWLWPGVLVLAGLSTLVIAIANPEDLQARHRETKARAQQGRKSKPKRGIPVPPALDDDDVLEILPFDETLDDDLYDDEDESFTRRSARR